MARYLVVQEFEIDVFADHAYEVYGIASLDVTDFTCTTTRWKVDRRPDEKFERLMGSKKQFRELNIALKSI